MRRVRAACAAASADTFLAQELQRLEAQAEAAAQEAHEGQAQLQKQAEELKLCRRRLRHVQGDLQVRSPVFCSMYAEDSRAACSCPAWGVLRAPVQRGATGP